MNDNRNRTILLVDDDMDVLAGIRRALSPNSYRILEASRAQQAITMLAETEVDLIISDIEMPEMNGLELMEVARRASPRTTRIIVSGAGTLERSTRAINSGEVHRFIHKPFDPVVLRRIVADALERQVELERASAASWATDRKSLLIDQLERDYPGVTEVERDESGAYVLDEQRAFTLARRLGLTSFIDEDTPTKP